MLKHLFYSQDNIKMTFCLVFIIAKVKIKM